MSTPLFLVFTNPTEGRDDEFNKWYDEIHLPDVCAVPGIVAAQRYDLIDFTPDVPDDMEAEAPPPPEHRYLAVYELDGAPDTVFAEFFARLGDGRMNLSESLDMSTVKMGFWSPHGSRLSG
jgi:hypothetical protein